MPHLLGMHLRLVHDVIHLASGGAAPYFRFAGTAPEEARQQMLARLRQR